MKKITCLLLALCLLASSLLAGCNPAVTPAPDTEETTSSSDTVHGTVTEDTEAETPTGTEDETEYDDPALKLDHLTIGGVDISEYTVVVPETPATYDLQAAEFLVRFIGEATGVTLRQTTDAESSTHMILVGTTAHDTDAVKAARAEVTDDGYAMLMDNGSLYITSNIPRGTIYGVYDFLEKYVGVYLYAGVQHYPEQSGLTRTELYDIKENLRVEVPADLRTVFNPAFSDRHSTWARAQLAQGTYPQWNAWNFTDEGMGIDAYEPGFCHTIGYLAETGASIGSQPCLTDENIYQTVLKNVRWILEKYPDTRFFEISQNDAYGGDYGCQCETCMAVVAEEESYSGPWVRFVNRIANEIKDDFPNVTVTTLAYMFTQKPPKHVKPAENVGVRLCSSNACLAHALTDPNCPRNVEFSEYIQAWSEICDTLLIWHYGAYFLDTDSGGCNSVGPNLRVILQDAKFFKEHNVRSVFVEGKEAATQTANSMEMGELRSYLWGKVLWNPDMTQEEFDGYLNGFLDFYYGDAGQLIMQYQDKLNDSLYDNSKYNSFMTGHTVVLADYRSLIHMYDRDGNLSIAFVRELDAIWREIDALDTLSDLQRFHTDCASLQFYSAAMDIARGIYNSTKDEELNKMVLEYRNRRETLRKRCGVN